MTRKELPLVDVQALHSLEESMDGQGLLSFAFVYRYVQMWPQRFERIHHAVSSAQWDDAMDAAISLYSSSAMAGTPRLSQLADTFVQMLKEHKRNEAAKMLAKLRRCGDQTAIELTARYLSPAP